MGNKKGVDIASFDAFVFNGMYEMIALPLEQLNLWLLSINSEKVKPAQRNIIILYQREFCDLVADYWNPRELAISSKKQWTKKKQLAKADEIDFHGQKLLTVKVAGKIFAAMKPIVDGMGLDWKTQHRKIQQSLRLKHMTIPFQTTGGVQKMLAMPIEKLNGWLLSINSEKVRPDLRDMVILYQDECFDVLYQYWHQGKAENPRFKNKRQGIDHIKANRLIKSFVQSHKALGCNQSMAMLRAMDNLWDQYGYDYPASLGHTRAEIEAFLIKKHGPPKDSHKSQGDWGEIVFCQWLNALLEDSELWETAQTVNIRALYNTYISFCQALEKGCQSYNGWQRQLRKVFREYIQRVQKTREGRRYYKFADLETCRRQLAEYIEKNELWPALPSSLDIN